MASVSATRKYHVRSQQTIIVHHVYSYFVIMNTSGKKVINASGVSDVIPNYSQKQSPANRNMG